MTSLSERDTLAAGIPPSSVSKNNDSLLANADTDGQLPATSDVRSLSELRWNVCMKSISRCEAAPGIRESSIYSVTSKHSESKAMTGELPLSCMKPLVRELRSLHRMLPSHLNSSIWLRFDEDTPQFMRAMMTAPDSTPYAGGLFVFDIYVPNDYPMRSPYLTLLTTGRGSVRFGPNLYADGTVCLSILGTWNGPQWNPLSSNLYQLLVSVQSLVLGVEQPYYLEPGRGGWEGTIRAADTKEGASMIQVERRRRGTVIKTLPRHVRRYNAYLTSATAQWAMLDHLRPPAWNRLEAFHDVIRAHFYCNGKAIGERLDQLCDSTPWCARTLRLIKLKTTILPELKACIDSLEQPTNLQGNDTREHLQNLQEDDIVDESSQVEAMSLHGRTFAVTIPTAVVPGGRFTVSASNHRVELCCPKDGKDGMTLYFRLFFEANGEHYHETLGISSLKEYDLTDSTNSTDSSADGALTHAILPKRSFFPKLKLPKGIRSAFQPKHPNECAEEVYA